VLAHKALIVKYSMSGAPSNEIKDEPQSGVGCEAAAFMNARAELLQQGLEIGSEIFKIGIDI